MADTKISALGAAGALAGTEPVPTVQAGTTVKTTTQDIADLATATTVGLGNVTNDAQTKASIVPNTAPSAGEVLIGNAGGTAYAKQAITGDLALDSDGVATLATVNSDVGSFTNASVTVNAKGQVTAASSGAASGDVIGPASSTDNAVARFNGTGGKTLQDSGVTVSDVSGSSVTLASTAGNALAVAATAPAQITTAQAGVAASLKASAAVAGSSVAGAAAGGEVTIEGGAAARLTSGNANGGPVRLKPGAGVGTGTAGQVILDASGSATSPALRYATGSGTGWYDAGSGDWAYSRFGTIVFGITGGNDLQVNGSSGINWYPSAIGAHDTSMRRVAANSIQFAGNANAAGFATSRTEINKLVSSIADATATAVFTVTVPNAAHSANVEVTLNGSLGAGGAIGANEATGTIKYNVSIARTAGVNAVATISTAYGSATSSVAGAATITVTGDLGAVSGAVGATNTFTIRVTITKGSGSSANHTCTAHAVLVNANSSGVTIS